jgi:hypothetical protein
LEETVDLSSDRLLMNELNSMVSKLCTMLISRIRKRKCNEPLFPFLLLCWFVCSRAHTHTHIYQLLIFKTYAFSFFIITIIWRHLINTEISRLCASRRLTTPTTASVRTESHIRWSQFRPRRDHEGPEGDKYSSTLSLTPGKRAGNHYTEGWVWPRAILEGCGKCRPPPDSIRESQ